MENWENNLKKRPGAKIKDYFTEQKEQKEQEELATTKFLLAPHDEGVVRNGGRRGARHAPACILHHFKNLATHHCPYNFSAHYVTSKPNDVESDFDDMQSAQKESISHHIDKHTFHLGGGHDHVYPFTSALIKKYGKLNIINVDAHLDTRNDPCFHSGTPFRQLAVEHPSCFQLIQIGIQKAANVTSNYEGLTMDIVTSVNDIKFADNSAPLLLSIDCDGLDGSFMPAVSAFNPNGLGQESFEEILSFSQKYWQKQGQILCGIYEFNPLFDNLAAGAAKYMSHFLYKALQLD